MPDVDEYPAVDTGEEERKKNAYDLYPPVAAIAPATGDVPAPALEAMGTPPIAPSPMGEQSQPAPPARPTMADYPVPKPSLGKRIALGMAAFGGPETARIAEENVYQAPARRAQQEYQAATGAYDTQFNQGLAQRRELREKGTEESQAQLRTAQTDEARARAESLRHPTGKDEDIVKAYGQALIDGDMKRANELKPRVEEFLTTTQKPGKQVSTKEDLQSQLADELAKGAKADKKVVRDLQQRLREIDPLAEDRIRDAENRAATAAKKGEEKTDLATREKVLTYFKPAQDADVRLNLMEESERDALKGNQQAMVNLVANHVAMVMGMPRGKVPRVSHEFFDEAIKAAPILQRAEAHFDKDGYLTGIVLSPEQMRAMVKLGEQTRKAEWDSANSSADYIGIDKNDRPKTSYKGGTTGVSGAAPANAESEVLKDGKVIGHIVTENGKKKYVPLAKVQ